MRTPTITGALPGHMIDSLLTLHSVDRRAHEKSRTCCLCCPFSPRAERQYLLLGAFLITSPSGGGFFPNLGSVLGLLVLGIGNLVSSICNGIYWWFGKSPRWLGIVTLVQGLPTLLFMGLIMSGMAPVS